LVAQVKSRFRISTFHHAQSPDRKTKMTTTMFQ